MRLLALGLVAACYSPPRDAACTIACETTAECPSGLDCIAGRCGSCDVIGDSGVDVDDVGVDVSPNAVCAGLPAGFLPNTCFDPPFADTLLATNVSTDDPSLCNRVVPGSGVGSPSLCIVIEHVIDHPVHVTGSRVLVLWSPSTLDVTTVGLVDAASRTTESPQRGPAASIGRDDIPPSVNGGAAGGSFGALGGDGGAAGGPGGMATLPQVVDGLRGGFAGGSAVASASGGAPGGVVYLMAHDQIVIAGGVDASGGAGEGGFQGTGAGGGGSGGLVGLDAPMISVLATGTVMAVGGGGGAGGGVAQNGSNGDDPGCCPFDPARGTSSPPSAGGGGAGGTGSKGAVGGTGTASAGGGGGGGSTGIIRVFSMGTISIAGTLIPPPPS